MKNIIGTISYILVGISAFIFGVKGYIYLRKGLKNTNGTVINIKQILKGNVNKESLSIAGKNILIAYILLAILLIIIALMGNV